MSDLTPRYPTPPRFEPARGAGHGSQPQGLADVLDRILDKGLVIAGDISISLAQVELVTIKIRLLLASADKAQEMGIDWWTRDPSLSSGAAALGGGGGGEGEGDGDGEEEGDVEQENRALRERVAELESKLSGLLSGGESVASRSEPISAADLIGMQQQKTAPPAPRRPSSGGDEEDGDDEPGAEADSGDDEPDAEADSRDDDRDAEGNEADERDTGDEAPERGGEGSGGRDRGGTQEG